MTRQLGRRLALWMAGLFRDWGQVLCDMVEDDLRQEGESDGRRQ